MGQPIISVEHLSKRYRIAHHGQRAKYSTLREAIAAKSRGLVSSLTPGKRSAPANGAQSSQEDFWALKDVSFEVQQGEVLGVIGRNGAGKSTLLKILSRITEPTEGRVTLRGRIASLLEVGTGFHPELTGRENVYLNGAILGMSRAEIKRKFDEIVDFAGVEKFLDTPVKRYSSGMYVRLAFAVAAHLEPEILIVDEVLAVGDAEFQKKCMGKMQDVSTKEGRTVLFVSHNIQAILSLTTKSVLLSKGSLMSNGPTMEVASGYLTSGFGSDLCYADHIPAVDTPKIARVELMTSEPSNSHTHGSRLEIIIDIDCPIPTRNGGSITIRAVNMYNVSVVDFWTYNSDIEFLNSTGVVRLTCVVPKCRLYLGSYSLTIFLADASGHTLIHKLEDVCPFEVSMSSVPRHLPFQEGISTYLDECLWLPPESVKPEGAQSNIPMVLNVNSPDSTEAYLV
jgi:ABC-type polysaccharide/polyol phosphate transport system ATPase subunit